MGLMLLGLIPTIAVVVAFLFGLSRGITTLILIRPICDRIFDAGRFDVAGHAISYGALINIVVICVLLFHIGNLRRRVPPSLVIMWLPFLLIALTAVLYSPVAVDGLRKWLTYVSFFAMFLLSFLVVKSERDTIHYLKIIVLSSVVPLAYAFFQFLSGIDWYADSRISSTFSHPNIFAFYILATIGVIFVLLVTDGGRMGQRVRLLLNLYLIPLLIALILTKTRSAWVACAILVLFYGLVYDKRALFLVLTAPLFVLTIPAIYDRIIDLTSRNDFSGGNAGAHVNALAWREIMWDSALNYIQQRPAFGFGLDSFTFYSTEFFPLDRLGHEAHNMYVQFAFEMGLVGLICFLWIFVQCFLWLGVRWRLDRRGVAISATLLFIFALLCYSDNIFDYLSFNWCFWFSCGLCFARLVQVRGTFSSRRHHRRRLGNGNASYAGETRRTVAS
jgi:O-antigen ligase